MSNQWFQQPHPDEKAPTRYPASRLRPEDLPKEPFSYMGTRRSIQSPLGQVTFAAFIFLMAAVLFLAVLMDSAQTGRPGLAVLAVVLLLVFGGLGTAAMIIGVKRMRWRREYIRITGQRPWS
ncbi:hypothetical protein ACT3TS_10795 [Specibacter sp. AOP5-B1-6]|uniref:hypothetical protein n=1 Tax=Specibacter sp. AOP5-B1-6 TaxID=3457653 RepID=UPI00402B0CA5